MRALIIEDEPATQNALGIMLTSAGYKWDVASNGEEGAQLAEHYDYDIIILDLMLSDITGYEIILRLRSKKIKTPIMILSGLSGADHKVKGFSFGADDFVNKPYDKNELLARINAIIRRSKGHSDSVIRFDKVTINIDTRTVEVEGTPLHLTSKEYAILELLAMRKGTVLTKEMFLNHLYGGIDEPELKIIDVFVCKLRKKLADASGGLNYIETVWGRGYMLRENPVKTDQLNETMDSMHAE
ncbi:MAG: response regulator transcription factor [Sphingobacteriia bacterium]|nr:response regulator transcription factor [Sphingobacteriia bacterium]